MTTKSSVLDKRALKCIHLRCSMIMNLHVSTFILSGLKALLEAVDKILHILTLHHRSCNMAHMGNKDEHKKSCFVALPTAGFSSLSQVSTQQHIQVSLLK